MSSSKFPFIPRKLAKSGRPVETAKKPRTTQTSNFQPKIRDEQEVSTSTSHIKKEEEKCLDDSSYTALFGLALSEYALWSNAELLEIVEANEDGFAPISYLVQTSPVFAGLLTIPPETVLMRCVRSSSILEGRLIVSEPSSSGWSGGKRRHVTGGEGGFEVRRKDRAKVKDRIRKYTSFHWDSRTIYVENLPYHARTYHTVYEFVRQLLPGRCDKEPDNLPIQGISFPRHHRDTPNAPPPPVGKGFTFIILSHMKDADYLTERWPWNIDGQQENSCESEPSKIMQEAKSYGFRCMSKRRWDELKQEYLALQRHLLERTLSANAAGPSASNRVQSNGTPVPDHPRVDERSFVMGDRNKGIVEADVPTWFPKDCLVFVKNVHAETNKTTLRALFSSAFNNDDTPIDYVDYNKGLNSSYLRLSDAEHAQTLVSYFSKHKTMQVNALDNIGAPALDDMSIEVELVQEKKEEVYWEKVPEKIRQAAITKAHGKGEDQLSMMGKNEASAGGRKRKRRKRD